ncbi:hypothetical protein ACFLZV_00180 [Candidatus Margulisiibacteriota bacterium]
MKRLLIVLIFYVLAIPVNAEDGCFWYEKASQFQSVTKENGQNNYYTAKNKQNVSSKSKKNHKKSFQEIAGGLVKGKKKRLMKAPVLIQPAFVNMQKLVKKKKIVKLRTSFNKDIIRTTSFQDIAEMVKCKKKIDSIN